MKNPTLRKPQKPNPQVQEMSEDTKTIITLLLLITVPPVGLILIWILTRWRGWVKVLITALGCFYFITLFGLVFFGVMHLLLGSYRPTRMGGERSYKIEETNIAPIANNTALTAYTQTDGTSGYSVSYSSKELISCADENANQKELTLWEAPFDCSEANDVPYFIRIGGSMRWKDSFFDESNLVSDTGILLDGVIANKRTYEFSPEDGLLYDLGGASVVVVESPVLDAGGEKKLVIIEMNGNSIGRHALFNEFLASFKWQN